MVLKVILWLAWLGVGLLTIIKGDVSRLSYTCAWVIALMFMLLDMME